MRRFDLNMTTPVRFSAFLMTPSGRNTSGGKPMLDYALIENEDRYRAGDVVLDGRVVGESPAFAEICRDLERFSTRPPERQLARLAAIIRREAGGWKMTENIGERKHLLEGSMVRARRDEAGFFRLEYAKPARR